MNHENVTEKLTEIIQSLLEHYDYAVGEDDAAMKVVHEKKRAAEQKYEDVDKRLDHETKEMISELMGAYEEEYHLLSVYAFLHGLKCGMRIDEWCHTDGGPLFLS